MEQHTTLTGSSEEVAELLRAAESIAVSVHSEQERAPEILETSISASAVGQAAIEVARIPRHRLDEEKLKYVAQIGRVLARYREEALLNQKDFVKAA